MATKGAADIFTIERATEKKCKARADELYGEGCYEVVLEGYKDVPVFGGLFTKNVYQLKGYKTLSPLAPFIRKEVEKQKTDAPPPAGSDTTMTQTLAELHTKFDSLAQKIDGRAAAPEHENITRIDELLAQNDFLPAFRKKMLSKLKKEVSLETLNNFVELEQRVLELVGEEIRIYTPKKIHLPRVIVLVGPTGVGKTTTVAKLATRFIYGNDYGLERDFRTGLITIDLYRMGAEEQLRKYVDIWSTDHTVPFETAKNEEEFKLKLTLMKENADVIIVDTMGRGPWDSTKLAEIKKLLSACGSRAEFFLAVSASTSALNVVSILKQFEIFECSSVIITKLDETRYAGNVISALAETGKSVAYLTDSQLAVPKHLVQATPIRLLINLDGFEVNRDRLEKYFGSKIE